MLGPVLLTVAQAIEYTFYYFLAFPSVSVSFSQLFNQYFRFVGFNGYYVIGALIGGVSGALLAAWHHNNLAWVRRVAALSVLLALGVGFVTIFVFDPESGIWGMGAPELQAWLLRVLFNSALKWCLLLVIAAWLAARQLARK